MPQTNQTPGPPPCPKCGRDAKDWDQMGAYLVCLGGHRYHDFPITRERLKHEGLMTRQDCEAVLGLAKRLADQLGVFVERDDQQLPPTGAMVEAARQGVADAIKILPEGTLRHLAGVAAGR